MERASIDRVVRRIVSQHALEDVSELAPEASLSALAGLDSLSVLEVLAGLEQHYGFRLTDTELATPRTLEQLVDLVERELAPAGEETRCASA